ncbi:phosphate signaling complex protein PhoU [Aestuariivirga litoralis]|uniref:phosphate signaling complex protein PhoU n=1 Tax=Aestuariivirga litoralis TaxID=2650924 RepID=UPI0018C48A04|nr:phosphate signaling complex protein PhoU [Aestuariivirga litoralis]MBG1233742.1 phosphate signaling complex protein PhoU [Aestuariivirga litoralis]
MSDHILKAYDDDLAALKSMLSEMGGLCEEQLQHAMTALVKRDTKLADSVIGGDDKIDAMEVAIEERAVVTIAKRQPMARDLRNIMVAIRIASDLERIGDLAKNVAKRAHAVNERMPRSLSSGVERMGQLSQAQLKLVLDAFAANDAEKALEVWRHDEDIDALYNSIFRELLTYMMEDPRMIGACTHLLFATKNIERIGDHATNIAENIYYLVHGKPLRDERPKKDKTSITPFDGK